MKFLGQTEEVLDFFGLSQKVFNKTRQIGKNMI